jgi:hypothetical protein
LILFNFENRQFIALQAIEDVKFDINLSLIINVDCPQFLERANISA